MKIRNEPGRKKLMVKNANIETDPAQEVQTGTGTPKTTEYSEVPLSAEDLNRELTDLLPPVDYRALRRFALILIDIARNPTLPQDKNSGLDSKS